MQSRGHADFQRFGVGRRSRPFAASWETAQNAAGGRLFFLLLISVKRIAAYAILLRV